MIVRFVLGSWQKDPEADSAVIRDLVFALASVNRTILIRNPRLPLLYHAPVRYVEDGWDRPDDWCDYLEILRRGYADCKSLVAARLAELQLSGIKADVRVTWEFSIDANGTERRSFHVSLVTPQGTEDPSRLLGMRLR